MRVINKDSHASKIKEAYYKENYYFEKKSHNFLSGNPYYGTLCFDKKNSLETWSLGLLRYKRCEVEILEVYNERYKVKVTNTVSACPKEKKFMIESKLLCEYQEKKGLK